jgi:hypothetical protein
MSAARARTKALTHDVTSDLFSVSSVSPGGQRHSLSRPWRDAGRHGSHDRARKHHHLGNHLLRGALLPDRGQP